MLYFSLVRLLALEFWAKSRTIGGVPRIAGSLAEVAAGGLEGGEKEAGAGKVDLVGGDEVDQLAEGALEFGPIGGKRQGERPAGEATGAEMGAALAAAGDVRAGGVVVVAEGLPAKGGRAAGAGGSGVRRREDVATEGADFLVLAGLGCVVHVVSPSPEGTFLAKV
jgi:hypothetical protein